MLLLLLLLLLLQLLSEWFGSVGRIFMSENPPKYCPEAVSVGFENYWVTFIYRRERASPRPRCTEDRDPYRLFCASAHFTLRLCWAHTQECLSRSTLRYVSTGVFDATSRTSAIGMVCWRQSVRAAGLCDNKVK